MKLSRFTNGKVRYWGLSGDRADLNAYMSLWGEREPIDLYSRSLLCGVIDPVDPFLNVSENEPAFPFSFELLPAMSPELIAASALLKSVERPNIPIDWEQLNATPERLKFQLSQYGTQCWGQQKAVEIGRFITQKNEIGLIKSIQTEVNFDDNDLRWPRGDSRWYNRTLATAPNMGQADIAWCLKIESLHDALDPNFRIIDVTTPAEWFREIPGVVHPEIAPWDRMLFLWGADHEVHFICPPDSYVSLWVYLFPVGATITGIRRIGGMLKGYTQIMESARTYENLTRSY